MLYTWIETYSRCRWILMTFMDERKGLSNNRQSRNVLYIKHIYIYVLYIVIESFKNQKLVANPVQFKCKRWSCQKIQAVCQAVPVDPGVPNKNGQSRTTCELKIASRTSEPQLVKHTSDSSMFIPKIWEQ